MPSSEFAERLSQWAASANRRRFWSVATAGSDSVVILLPTTSPDFIVLVTDEGERLLAQATHTPSGTSTSTLIGLVDEDPGETLGTAAVWLRESAADNSYPTPLRCQFAFAAALLAAELGDTDTQREAAALAEKLSG